MDIRTVIQKLGGPAKVAESCDVTPQAVSNWYGAGIPARHRLTLWRLAREAGLDWRPPGTEGLTIEPARPSGVAGVTRDAA